MLSATVLSLSCYACGDGTPLPEYAEPQIGAATTENGVYTSNSNNAPIAQTQTSQVPNVDDTNLAQAIANAASPFSVSPTSTTVIEGSATEEEKNTASIETQIVDSTVSVETSPDATSHIVPEPTPEPQKEVAVTSSPETLTETAAETTTEPQTVVSTEPKPKPEPEPEPESLPETAPAENNQETVAIAQQPVTVAEKPGKIKVGQSPGDAQCLNLPSSNKSFGSIGVSDWRNWVGNNDLAYAAENENLAVDASTDNRKSLRQKLAPASKGSTRSVARAGLTPGKTYRLTQSVYFEPGFDWGGKNEGGKLGFGLGGGSAPTGGLVRTDGFTLRFMWRGNKDGTAHIALYSYAADRGQKYGADYPLEGFDAPIGKWFELSMELTVNSATGVADGSVRAWADGVLRVERNNIAWQTSGGQPSVQDLFYTTFYGGNDTSWSPDHTTHVRFSDVCWAPVVDGYSGIDLDSGSTWLADQPSGDYIISHDQSSGAIEALEQSARNRIANTFFQLELLLPTEDPMLDWKLHRSLGLINNALASENWSSNNQLSDKTLMMPLLEQAINHLISASQLEGAAEFIRTESVGAAREISDVSTEVASDAIDFASQILDKRGCQNTTDIACEIAASELRQANSELSLAKELRDDPQQSITQAQLAWESARKAINILSE